MFRRPTRPLAMPPLRRAKRRREEGRPPPVVLNSGQQVQQGDEAAISVSDVRVSFEEPGKGENAETAECLKFIVAQLSGEVHQITVQPAASVLDLKIAIYHQTWMPVLAQRLLLNDSALDGDGDLLSQNMQEQEEEGAKTPRVTLLRQCSDEQAEWLSLWERSDGWLSHMNRDRFSDLDPLYRFLRREGHTSMERAALDFLQLPERFLQDENFLWFVMTKLKSEAFVQIKSVFLLCIRAQIRESANTPGKMDFAKLAMQIDARLVAKLDPHLMHIRELLLIALQTSGLILELAPPEFQAEMDIVVLAVQQTGEALNFASDDLKSNQEVVMIAVQKDGNALRFAHPALRADRVVVAAALQQEPLSLEFVASELKADIELVLMAVKLNGIALQFADPRLQGNHDIVAAAIQNSRKTKALQFASDALRSDQEIVFQALQQSAWAFEWAIPDLQADDEMRRRALLVAIDPQSPIDSTDSQTATLPQCLALLTQLVERKGFNSLDIGPTLTAFMMEYTPLAIARVTQDPQAYLCLENNRENPDVAHAAVKQDWSLFAHAPYRIRTNLKVQVAAVAQNRRVLQLCLPTERYRVMQEINALPADEVTPEIESK